MMGVGSIVEIVETELMHQSLLQTLGCVVVYPVEQTLNLMKCHWSIAQVKWLAIQ
tara:strand:+ start:1890 stop:2054 length:165 start_codon:yes stop_codon:yes gene_type:complete